MQRFQFKDVDWSHHIECILTRMYADIFSKMTYDWSRLSYLNNQFYDCREIRDQYVVFLHYFHKLSRPSFTSIIWRVWYFALLYSNNQCYISQTLLCVPCDSFHDEKSCELCSSCHSFNNCKRFHAFQSFLGRTVTMIKLKSSNIISINHLAYHA